MPQIKPYFLAVTYDQWFWSVQWVTPGAGNRRADIEGLLLTIPCQKNIYNYSKAMITTRSFLLSLDIQTRRGRPC